MTSTSRSRPSRRKQPARSITITRRPEFPLEDLSGFSVFYKNEMARSSTPIRLFGRGAEEVLGSYMLLDIAPKGRNENALPTST